MTASVGRHLVNSLGRQLTTSVGKQLTTLEERQLKTDNILAPICLVTKISLEILLSCGFIYS